MSFSTNLSKESSYILRGESSWSGEVKIYRFPPSPEFSQKLYSSQTFAVLEVQELVIESEWKLRNDTGEKWFFNAEEVEAFSKVIDGTEVVEQYPIHRSKVFKTSFSEPKVQT